jgi:hypothetical protein
MKRREFITLLGGAASWPIPSRGQEPNVGSFGAQSATAQAVTPAEPFEHVVQVDVRLEALA